MAFTERSEPARAAILEAARTAFAAHGFERTTIRRVASAAGVDPSMVMRYYGNKDGLFTAAINVNLTLEKVPARPRAEAGRALARHLLARWEVERAYWPVILLIRGSSTNPAAAEHLLRVYETQLIPFVARVTSDNVERRAALIAAHQLGLTHTRYVMDVPPLVAMTSEEIIAAVAPALQHYLTGDLTSS